MIERVTQNMHAAPVMTKPRVTVLGAGPAGIAAAYALTKHDKAFVEVLERAPVAGGNSTSFQIDGIWCDYGSHRFHPVADPTVIADVKSLLGDDLLLQPRHGRIRLGGKWIHFPLEPADALLRLPKPFAASLLGDMLFKPFRKKRGGAKTFSSVLYSGLGPTISENFYFPYVRKLWGLDPDKLSVTLAERRVSSGSVGKILAKMARMLPGMKGPTTGRFYYPKQGFGQISQSMVAKATEQGAAFKFGADIAKIERQDNRVTGLVLREGKTNRRVSAEQVYSTIPLTTVVRLMDPPPAARGDGGCRGDPLPGHDPRLPDPRHRPLHRIRRALLPRNLDPDQPDVGTEELQFRRRADGPHHPLRRTALRSGREMVGHVGRGTGQALLRLARPARPARHRARDPLRNPQAGACLSGL